MTRTDQRVKRRIIVTIAGMILLGAAAVSLTIRYPEPKPLSDEDILMIHTAIRAVATGDIRNLQQNRDGSVTAFISSGPYNKQTIVATKVGDEWSASVTMIYF